MRSLKILCFVLILTLTVIGASACSESPVSLETANISLSQTEYVYDGTEKQPDVTITLNEKEVSSNNYDVTYENNINAGTATVKVTGKGDYKGTVSTNFTIKKAVPTPEAITVTAEYNQTIADIVDAKGFTLDQTNTTPSDTVLINVGENTYSIKIVYTPKDTTNYEIGVQTVNITVVAEYTEDGDDNVVDDDDFTVTANT